MNARATGERQAPAAGGAEEEGSLTDAFEASTGTRVQAIAGIGCDGQVVFANGAFDALTGSRHADAPLEALVPEAEAPRVRALLDEAFLYGRTAATLTLGAHENGEVLRPLPVRFERAHVPGEPLAILVVETAGPESGAGTAEARRHEAKVAAALLETARAAGKAHDPVELCRLAAGAFFDVYPAPIVAIHILDKDANELRLVAAEGEARPWLDRVWRLPLVPESPSLLVQAAVQKRTLVKDRLEMVSRFPEFEAFPQGEVTPAEVMAAFARIGIRTIADAPIMFEGEVLGVIGIGSTRETVDEDAVRLLELLAHEIAAGLHRLRLESARAELLQATRDAHAELAEFTYNLSHDLSEDLRRVATFTEALENDYASALPSDAADLLDRVSETARKLQRRVRGSLELSRSLRKTRVDAHRVDLEPVVQASVARVTRKHEERSPVVHVDPGLAAVCADPEALPVMVDNLILNAIQFNEAERPEVWVSARPEGDYVDIIVEDNGPGIPPEYREHVLQPFRKLPAHENLPGTGMGLPVVAKLAARHGGRLLVESREGGPGARLRLRLPAGGAP